VIFLMALKRFSVYQKWIKPLTDRLMAALLLVMLSPVIVIVAIAVRLVLGKPVFFRQSRPGLEGAVFTLYKFRTMSSARDESGTLLPDAQRLGRFGRFLRSASLDELPQLFNILRGEMSFIGPRPLLVAYLPRYNAHQARRHAVRPGITGLAQVRGRNSLSWPERFEWDVRYVEQLSFWLDLKIALETVAKVLRREGVSADDHATMPPFLGNGDRVYVFGGGGHGRVVAESAARMGLRVEGFIDADERRGITYEAFLARSREALFGVVPAIGDNRTRRRCSEQLRRDGVLIISVVDPLAVVSPSAHVGAGAVVLSGAVINAGARVEEGAIVNSSAVIEHDCVVGAYAHISPNATLAGEATASPLSHIGAGATLLPASLVGKGSVIGAGAVVRGQIPPFVTAVGLPAHVIRIHEGE
jgi:sugar O-acyltransferase (sialic acid O-acetyltransferase NeuD family)